MPLKSGGMPANVSALENAGTLLSSDLILRLNGIQSSFKAEVVDKYTCNCLRRCELDYQVPLIVAT